jgi:hypothetical protein
MAIGTLELLAWIIIVASLIKMIIILVSAKSWMNFAKKVYDKPQLTSWIALILAAVVLYYLIGAGITITQILAVTVFMALLFMAGLSSYIKKIIKDVNLKTVLKEQWYYVLAWLALIVWGIIELTA